MVVAEIILTLEAIFSFALIITTAFCFFYTISLKIEKIYKPYTIFLKIYNIFVQFLTLLTYTRYNFFACLALQVISTGWTIILWTGFPKAPFSKPIYAFTLLGVATVHMVWMIYLIDYLPSFSEGITIFILYIWSTPIFVGGGLMKIGRRGRGQYVGFWKDVFGQFADGFRAQMNRIIGVNQQA